MNAVVFVGPSLAGAAAAPPPGVALAGPAMAGDLYRAARDGARVIGLVDGVFEDRPTVWHKEILWALERGVRVLGAASLGALRAAECAPFGMEGIGRVFEAVQRGAIADDSDLAVAHAPEELGWRPLTEARVNVRATLGAAVAAGALPLRAARALAAKAEALPFRALTWAALLDDLAPATRDRLAAWLPQGRVDLKRADALALIDAVASASAGEAPPRAGFRLEETRYWRVAVDWFEQRPASTEDEAVLDELRLDPARFERAAIRAYSRAAALAGPVGEITPDQLVEDLRLRLGLGAARDYEAWLTEVRGDPAALAEALVAEERLMLALEAAMPALAPAMLDELRIEGRFEALDARAAHKRRVLGPTDPVYREADLPALIDELCARRRVMIDSEDPDLVARSLALADRQALHQLLSRERAYLTTGGG